MLLDIDPLSQTLSRMQYDHNTDQLVIRTEQKADHILDANAVMRNDNSQPWRGEKNEFWRIGSMPEYELYKWLAEFNKGRPADESIHTIYSGDKRWNRFIMDKLNLGEFAKFKTAPVRL